MSRLPPLPPSISEEQKSNLRKRFESSGKKKFAAGCPVFDFDSEDSSSTFKKLLDYLILTVFLLLFIAGLVIGLYGTFVWIQSNYFQG